MQPAIDHARNSSRAVVERAMPAIALGLAIACISAAPGAHDTPLNADDPAYLRRQNAWFQAQDSRRQQQIRRLHADFQQLDADTRNRLTAVAQNYNAWLAKLPAVDRERVLAAPDSAARLELIRAMRGNEWVETLPKPYREEYARLDDATRRIKIQDWIEEETDRHEDWARAKKHWEEHPLGKAPQIFLNEGKAIETFVSHLREDLSEDQRKSLDDARIAAEEFGNYYWYAVEVVHLADRYPILPGKVGPKDFDSLPEQSKTFLVERDPQNFKIDGIVRN